MKFTQIPTIAFFKQLAVHGAQYLQRHLALVFSVDGNITYAAEISGNTNLVIRPDFPALVSLETVGSKGILVNARGNLPTEVLEQCYEVIQQNDSLRRTLERGWRFETVLMGFHSITSTFVSSDGFCPIAGAKDGIRRIDDRFDASDDAVVVFRGFDTMGVIKQAEYRSGMKHAPEWKFFAAPNFGTAQINGFEMLGHQPVYATSEGLRVAAEGILAEGDFVQVWRDSTGRVYALADRGLRSDGAVHTVVDDTTLVTGSVPQDLMAGLRLAYGVVSPRNPKGHGSIRALASTLVEKRGRIHVTEFNYLPLSS